MPIYSRRQALQSLASGFGYLAFASLAHEVAAKEAGPRTSGGLSPKPPHFAALAKRVLFLCMNGGPSHIDLLDYKPKLNEKTDHDSPVGRDRGGAKLMGSPFRFAQHGESGLWISELVPNLAKHADELCVINSMHTDLPNHSQAFLQ